ncbi:MAG TPA: hypothetical protein VGA40_08955 [Candidatus Acidoferrales bacterium]
MRTKRWGAGLLGAVVFVAMGAVAQSAPPQDPPKPPAKKEEAKKQKPKKVWTGEDLAKLRRPVDKYRAEKDKEADEAAKAAAAAKEAAAKEGQAKPEEKPPEGPINPATGKPYVDPESVEGMEKLLAQYEDQFKRSEEALEEARREMNTQRDPDRWESAKLKVETYEANILDLTQKMEETKAKIAAAKEKKPAPPPAKSGGN